MTSASTLQSFETLGACASAMPNRHFVAALPCVLPLGTTLLVLVVAFLYQTTGSSGAALHNFSTLIGTLFTIAAYLYMTALLWGPTGLFLSVLLSGTNTNGRYRLLHPLVYVACCVLAFGLLVVDPFGTITHFTD